MKWVAILIGFAVAVALAVLLMGCTVFRVTQIDESPGERTITTKLSGLAWFSGAQSITGIKALQTDKTQSFGTATLGQQGPTNAVAFVEALVKLAIEANKIGKPIP